MMIQQRVVIRLPRLPDVSEAMASIEVTTPDRVQERKGPKCVPLPAIAGAAAMQTESIDLMTIDGQLLRARFADKCPAIDFYRGFYVRQTSDGLVCAGRDSLRSRSGGDCRIKSFRRVVRKR